MIFFFNLNEENTICPEFTVTFENEIARRTQHHERLIARLVFHNTPGCDIARLRWMEVDLFWKTPFVIFLKQLKQVIQCVSEKSLFGSLRVFFSIRNPGLNL